MDLHSDMAGEVEAALRKLCELCSQAWTQNRSLTRQAGGAPIIAVIMEKWFHDPDIQGQGCRALMKFVASEEPVRTSLTDFRESVIQSGAIDGVVWAIASYPDKKSVQVHGLDALETILRINRYATYVVDKLKGTELIAASMKTFPDDAEVQKYACWAINRLVQNGHTICQQSCSGRTPPIG